VNVSVGAGTGDFSAFGLLSGGMGSSSTEKTAGCYFDSLTYTKALVSEVRPTPSITLHGTQIEIAWTPAGGTLESSPELGPAAEWGPVDTNNPVLLPINHPTRFYRVAIP
jgi:hypothetical protein